MKKFPEPNGVHYENELAYNVISTVMLEIGGQKFNRVTGKFLKLHDLLNSNIPEESSTLFISKDVNTLKKWSVNGNAYHPETGKRCVRLIVPLNFLDFNIPLSELIYHDVKYIIELDFSEQDSSYVKNNIECKMMFEYFEYRKTEEEDMSSEIVIEQVQWFTKNLESKPLMDEKNGDETRFSPPAQVSHHSEKSKGNVKIEKSSSELSNCDHKIRLNFNHPAKYIVIELLNKDGSEYNNNIREMYTEFNGEILNNIKDPVYYNNLVPSNYFNIKDGFPKN